jgi:hypothetical protein
MTDEQFAVFLAELKAIHATLRRRPLADDHADLIAALAEEFGPAPFTAAGVLMAAEEPGSEIAHALARLIDMEHPSAITLGRLLARLPELEAAGDRRGCRLFRVRG